MRSQRTFTPAQIGANILAKAISHLGEAETTGRNDGPYASRYLAYVGIETAESWCAAFASAMTGWTLEQMGLTLPHLVTASSHLAVDWALKHHTVQFVHTVLPGDWCILRGGDGDKATDGHAYHHTTLVERVEGMTVHWIGGNTGNKVARGQSDIIDVTLLRPYILP